MKRLRESPVLKASLCGVPSTEVLNATLTAYRYLPGAIKDMMCNIPHSGESRDGKQGSGVSGVID